MGVQREGEETSNKEREQLGEDGGEGEHGWPPPTATELGPGGEIKNHKENRLTGDIPTDIPIGQMGVSAIPDQENNSTRRLYLVEMGMIIEYCKAIYVIPFFSCHSESEWHMLGPASQGFHPLSALFV